MGPRNGGSNPMTFPFWEGITLGPMKVCPSPLREYPGYAPGEAAPPALRLRGTTPLNYERRVHFFGIGMYLFSN